MTTCVFLLLLVLQQLPQGAGVPGGDPLAEVQRTAQEWLDAVNLYRGDDVEAAVRALDTLTPTAEERVLDYARRAFLDIRERGVKARPGGFRWQIADLTAAGALQMEAAMVASRAPDERAVLHMAAHLSVADRIFALIAETGGDASAAPRWRLAIGLTMTAAGDYRRARAALIGACAKYPSSAELQLACGTLREDFAMRPAAVRIVVPSSRSTTRFTPRNVPPSMDPAGDLRNTVLIEFSRAEREWDAEVTGAHDALARALQLAPGSTEARLRLAHVEMLQHKDASAAARLEPLVANPSDRRAAYLARLFLADILMRTGAPDRAAALLEEAIAFVPSGQAAHVALARLARDRGAFEHAAVLVHRMLNAPVQPDDPWLGYPYGQFWVPGPLIAELRRAARGAR